MRHSKIDLTMNVYTDPRLLDVHGAWDALPTLPLDGRSQQRQLATGTAGAESLLAQMLAPNIDKASKSWSTGGKGQPEAPTRTDERTTDVSVYAVKRKKPLTTGVNGFRKERETGFEPATSSLGS